MMNSVKNVSKKEMEDILTFLKNNDSIFIAEIKGEKIQNEEALNMAINKIFGYPIPFNDFNGWVNWIRNVDWLEKDNYVLIIYNFKKFMAEDLEAKERIIEHFECNLIPWWNAGMKDFIDDKKRKPFTIYIVE